MALCQSRSTVLLHAISSYRTFMSSHTIHHYIYLHILILLVALEVLFNLKHLEYNQKYMNIWGDGFLPHDKFKCATHSKPYFENIDDLRLTLLKEKLTFNTIEKFKLF